MSVARLQVKALDKSFAVGGGWRRARRQVLHGVDLRVDAGEVVAVVGESGSGKSTIARIIARLETADAGQVLLDGRDVFADEPRRASLAYRGRVQMVFQDPFGSLNPVHDVAHHLVRPLLRHGRADAATARAKAIELLEAVELSPGATFIDRYPHELSGGQRQRVAIARALAVEPDVVLADEPTSMLDVSTRLGVLELLRGLARSRNLAIVFITHDLASARHLADRVAVLYAGRLVEQGPTPQVLEHPAHPYTRLLLSSLPHGRGFLHEAGADDALVDRRPPAVGCPFAARCPHVTPPCRDALPSWRPLGDGHEVRCVHYPNAPGGVVITFPDTFVWGAATSAYQIEGAVDVDGRGPSIWDRFCAEPGRIADGSSGAVACEHYHRYRDDVGLMADIGLNAYRFSIAWPRILPEGTGRIEPRGLDFYDRLVDALLDRGITPWPTLYHWDMPAALHERGHGWTHRASCDAFAEYTAVVAGRLGDRVKHWFTHNEPMCAAYLGYVEGQQAPGVRGDWPAALRVVHHLLVSHGMAVRALRDHVRDAKVGIVLNPVPTYPASPSEADALAARHVDGRLNRWFLDPLYGRGYPADMVQWHAEHGHLPGGLDFVRDGDLDLIASPTDLLGVNYYSRAIARSDVVTEHDNLPPTVVRSDEETEMGWEIAPGALTDLLVRLHRDYEPGTLFVAENGAAWSTAPDADGRIRDARRTRYVRDHLVACREALDAGVPLGGYFLWSLMDNFEWAFGFEKRFGIVWVDYETQARTLKDSGRWYASVIERGGFEPGEEGV